MATGIVGDDALVDWTSDLIVGAHFTAMVVRIFTNNHTPAVTDTVVSYNEATFSGYAAQTVAGWSAPTVTSHVGSTTSATNDFTITSGTQVVYGVFYTDPGGTKFYGAVLDPNAPVTLAITGTTDYLVTTTLTDQSA